MPFYQGTRRVLRSAAIRYPSVTFTPGVTETFNFTMAPNSPETAVFQFQNFPGNYAQIFTFEFLDGSHVSGGDYLQFCTYNGGSNQYYFWFKVDGSGSDPTPGGGGTELDIESTSTADAIAAVMQNAISSASISCNCDRSSNIITVTNNNVGAILSWPGYSGSFGTLTNVQTGSGPYTTIGGFTWYGSGSGYYIWYNQDSLGVDPGQQGDAVNPIQCNITTGMTPSDVATATGTAVNPYFAGYYNIVSDTIAMTASVVGNVEDGVVFGSSPSLTKIGGSDGRSVADYAPGGYFEYFYTDGTSYAIWLEVNGSGAAPGVATHEASASYLSVDSDPASVANDIAVAVGMLGGNFNVSTSGTSTVSMEVGAIGPCSDAMFPDTTDFTNPIITRQGSTIINLGTNAFTISGFRFITGTSVRLTCAGVLPAPLAINTTYYIIRVNSNTLKFASSSANAFAGTAVDITDLGNGAPITIRQYP